MIDQIKVSQIDDGCQLHMMQSKKFKTIILGLYIRRPLNEAEVSKNALLSRLLDQGTETYRTLKAFNRKMEDLYGSVVVLDVHKYGDEQMIQLKLQMPNGKFVKDADLLEEGVKVLNEIINHPLVENKGFNPAIFDREKRNLIDEIESRKDDKMMHSVDMCIEKMFEEDIYSLHEYGRVDLVKTIDNAALFNHYQTLLKTSPMDICVIGDIDFDQVEGLIKKHFKIERQPLIEVSQRNFKLPARPVRKVVEYHDVKQGKLTLGFDTNIAFNTKAYYASILLANILGGDSHSKFFVNLREKESLCYYIFARVEKFKSLMIVSAGIEFGNYDKALALILEEIKKVQEGGFDLEDIQISKKTMIDGLKSISDYSNSYMNYYYGNLIAKRSYDIEKIIDKINAVTKEEIIEVSQALRLDTISFIDKEEDKGQVE